MQRRRPGQKKPTSLDKPIAPGSVLYRMLQQIARRVAACLLTRAYPDKDPPRHRRKYFRMARAIWSTEHSTDNHER